jgi:hypothetical protein
MVKLLPSKDKALSSKSCTTPPNKKKKKKGKNFLKTQRKQWKSCFIVIIG